MANNILTIKDKKEEKFLRKKTEDFEFKLSRKEIGELILKMKHTMRDAAGIGLSANQIGLEWKIFVAEVPDTQGSHKSYAIFNPQIEKFSRGKVGLEEGCLSIPGVYGTTPRYEKVVLQAQDKNGKKVKIKAWGLLAHIFQHETDHLAGKLYIDTAKKTYKLPESDRLKEK